MRVRVVLMALGVFGSGAAACTLWVDSHWSGYSSSCQMPNGQANACGQCATTNCQQYIDTTCGQNITDQLDQCFTNPSDPSQDPSSWSCYPFFDDASVDDPTQTQDESNLRHCVQRSCAVPCSTCTDFEAGAGVCGECLSTNCASIMNGIGGCCDDQTIASGMVACGSSVNHDCSAFLTYDTILPDSGDDFEHCMRVFSSCVQAHCATACK